MTSSALGEGLRCDNSGVIKVFQKAPVNHDNMGQSDSPTDCLADNPSNHLSETNCQQVVEMEKYEM